jgi:chitinase
MMKKQNRLATVFYLGIATLCVFEALQAEVSESYVLGYYPSGKKTIFPAENIDFKTITHICHAFVVPNKDGTLHYREGFLYPELIRKAHEAGRKVLVSLGGGGGGRAVEGFPPVAASRELRKKFISNLVDFCVTHGYDGIDFDWEYPKSTEERDNHAILVSELRDAVDQLDPPLLITMAIGGRLGSDKTFDHAILQEKLDWFNVMTYDFHGPWMNRAGHNSPIYSVSPRGNNVPQGCYSAISFLRDDMGIPPEKLLLGLPFYGFVLKASHIHGPSDGGRYIDYREIMLKWAEGGWTYEWDEVSMVPWMINDAHDSLITFDNPKSIALKCDFARVNELRGVMIWALGQDVIEGRPLLLEVVGQEKWKFKKATD